MTSDNLDITDADMPDGMDAKPGMGDLEEQFVAVTRDLDAIKRVPDPMVDTDPGQGFDDIQRDASEAAASAVDEPGSDELDLAMDMDFSMEMGMEMEGFE